MYICAYISISTNIKKADLSCQRSECWTLQPQPFLDAILGVPLVRLNEEIKQKMEKPLPGPHSRAGAHSCLQVYNAELGFSQAWLRW